ncbi:hypothetical protein HDE_05645 [Halotydeus destructor]|nr:hypothetical protein HDE_05645 [Halotydeus destructor]
MTLLRNSLVIAILLCALLSTVTAKKPKSAKGTKEAPKLDTDDELSDRNDFSFAWEPPTSRGQSTDYQDVSNDRSPMYWVPNPWLKLLQEATVRRAPPRKASGRSKSVSSCNCNANAHSYNYPSSSPKEDYNDYENEDGDNGQQFEDGQRFEDVRMPEPFSQVDETRNGRTRVTYKGEELTDDNLDFICTRYMEQKSPKSGRNKKVQSSRATASASSSATSRSLPVVTAKRARTEEKWRPMIVSQPRSVTNFKKVPAARTSYYRRS